MLADQYIVYVARPSGTTRNHVQVKLTIVYDRVGEYARRPLLEWAASLLSGWDRLPDKCEVNLSVTEILLHMLAHCTPAQLTQFD